MCITLDTTFARSRLTDSQFHKPFHKLATWNIHPQSFSPTTTLNSNRTYRTFSTPNTRQHSIIVTPTCKNERVHDKKMTWRSRSDVGERQTAQEVMPKMSLSERVCVHHHDCDCVCVCVSQTRTRRHIERTGSSTKHRLGTSSLRHAAVASPTARVMRRRRRRFVQSMPQWYMKGGAGEILEQHCHGYTMQWCCSYASQPPQSKQPGAVDSSFSSYKRIKCTHKHIEHRNAFRCRDGKKEVALYYNWIYVCIRLAYNMRSTIVSHRNRPQRGSVAEMLCGWCRRCCWMRQCDRALRRQGKSNFKIEQ